MKDLGICVCYDSHNFGSQLQVFATIYTLKKQNVDFDIICYNKKLTIPFIIKSLPRLLNYSFVSSKIKSKIKFNHLKKDQENYKLYKTNEEKFKKFEKENFSKYYKKYYGYNELKKATKNYKGFLVGSDQLWLPSNLGSNFYNLKFANNSNIKISYATSFGVSQIPRYQYSRTKNYLEKIDYLSVREESGKNIIEKISNAKCKVIVDPTLALSNDDWLKSIPNKKMIKEKYILCYFLGNNHEYIDVVKSFADRENFKLVIIPTIDSYQKNDTRYKDYLLYGVSTEDFVNLIRNSEYVMTDSFHGSVFSILNHKKFIVFNRFKEGKNSRNSRIDNLCNMLELNDRKYNGKSVDCVIKEIDYKKVDKILQVKRKESNDFLTTSLKSLKRGNKNEKN